MLLDRLPNSLAIDLLIADAFYMPMKPAGSLVEILK